MFTFILLQQVLHEFAPDSHSFIKTVTEDIMHVLLQTAGVDRIIDISNRQQPARLRPKKNECQKQTTIDREKLHVSAGEMYLMICVELSEDH